MPSPTLLALPVRRPFDWPAIAGFLAPRAIPGVEQVDGLVYRRSIRLDGRHGCLAIGPDAAGAAALQVVIRFPDPAAHPAIVARLVRQFDLMTDVAAMAAELGRDPILAPLVARWPGLRVPGAWDPFELSVRAILGQQVSVAAATTLAGRVAVLYGTPLTLADGPAPPGLTHVFPEPADLVAADPARLRIPRARAATLAGLARAVGDRPSLLSGDQPLDDSVAALDALPGIGPWTAHYIALRGLRAPDAFPSGDLGLRQALAVEGILPSPRQMDMLAEAWRPWRAYAALYLWMSLGDRAGG